jgi:hypothetical protein
VSGASVGLVFGALVGVAIFDGEHDGGYRAGKDSQSVHVGLGQCRDERGDEDVPASESRALLRERGWLTDPVPA